jgi:hypothetical protein
MNIAGPEKQALLHVKYLSMGSIKRLINIYPGWEGGISQLVKNESGFI